MNLTAGLDFDRLAALKASLGSSDKVFARALTSGIKSASFHVKKKLTEAVKNNSLGWAPLRTYPGKTEQFGQVMVKRLRIMAPAKNVTRPTNSKLGVLFGKLVSIIRYNYDPAKIRGTIGVLPEFTGMKSAILARCFQEGRRLSETGNLITPNMRKYFAAIGMPFSPLKDTIEIPKRQLFGPVFDREVENIRVLVFTVVADKLTNGFSHRGIIDKAV